MASTNQADLNVTSLAGKGLRRAPIPDAPARHPAELADACGCHVPRAVCRLHGNLLANFLPAGPSLMGGRTEAEASTIHAIGVLRLHGEHQVTSW